uniref:EGF-like domain-containing protein n=1 Tax=Callorhinchus milii TaxID=7868 RepID=A0A4W3GKV2_CALMI
VSQTDRQKKKERKKGRKKKKERERKRKKERKKERKWKKERERAKKRGARETNLYFYQFPFLSLFRSFDPFSSDVFITDINECQSSPCGSFAGCHNIKGGFRCVCDRGFVSGPGEGSLNTITHCKDINECQSSPCGSYAGCHNTNGGFRCECDKGFVSGPGEGSFNTITHCKGKDLTVPLRQSH